MKTPITVAVLLALIAFSIDFRSKHHYKKENIMSTTPHKHAEVIKAWADGKEVEYFDVGARQWRPCDEHLFHEEIQHRIKPEPAAPVYPETLATKREIYDAVQPACGTPFSDIDPNGWRNIRDLMNYAIRRAIDDGQVVPLDPSLHDLQKKLMKASRFEYEADRKRLELAEKALVEAGYERFDITGHWRKSDVVNAEFTPPVQHQDGEVVKIGDQSFQVIGGRRSGKTSAAIYVLQKELIAVTAKLAHAERVLKANGFTYSPDEGWSIHSDNMSKELRAGLLSVHELCERHEKEMEIALGKQRRAEQHLMLAANLADRVAHAVAKHFGATTQQQFKQADAIVLLEKAK